MASGKRKLDAISPPLEFVKKVGEGGMGEVSLYHDTSLDRPVIVKSMRLDRMDSASLLQRFEREVLVLAQLNHPNIVSIFGYWKAQEELYLSMEFVNGWTLRQMLSAERIPPHWVTLSICWQSLQALAYAHAPYAHSGIGAVVHRDIKPANIMIGFHGRVKLLDFGISRIQNGRIQELLHGRPQDITNANETLGTVVYMSPEQAMGDPVGPSADLFSFGSILWEMLTGAHPFRADNAVATAHQIVHKDLNIKALSSAPKGLAELAISLLQKDPTHRPTAEEALAKLDAMMADLPRDLTPLLGHHLLHLRKPESTPTVPDLQKHRIPQSKGLLFVSLAIGMGIGILIGVLG